ncbi:lipopolysaccharide biosynthesis protein [Streptococcus uberis]|uniref:polysaccharide biosynthesis C-terminal domain-containing protein n=1 Tax=Streptococcus uberis TaxID=1349 RepID=UPI0027DD7FB8|nr:polysaccharide biosynthesis C-terminal domain-containing protein [Streptococcus uberis]MCK1192348.1 polysaccharide biosynthesis C-terminal domain-containing protein [Streptococcus uberis]MCK1252863.1 polysaccharide biosynthesis C-terminal domain-containing protein [Streptococcus uberis]MCK1254685.1 polysaccharide biosynthesis C-terminal domain-containing protein [Streptococcus uberis]
MINRFKIGQKISQKEVFLWNIIGSLASAAMSTLLLLSVTRILDEYSTDIFSIAFAVGNLLITVASFQVRDFQATDIKEKYTFNNYFYARLFTISVMLLVAIAYIFMRSYGEYKSLCILLICFYRCSDALSDVFQGMFQQHERLDIAGKSLFYRNGFIFVGFTLALFLTHNLLQSLIIMNALSFIFVIAFDFAISRYFISIEVSHFSIEQIWKLLIESSPLFFNAFLLVSIYNQPKIALDNLFERGLLEVGIQTDFNILFMPVFAMNLTMIFFRPIMTQMAIFLEKGEYKSFYLYRKKLLQILSIISLLILIVVSIIGVPVLNIVYSTNLDKYIVAFVILMVGGIASTFATVCDNILTVLRKQKLLVISFISGFCVSYLSANPLVEHFGIYGASISFTLSMLTWLLVSLAIYFFAKDSYKEKK